MTIILNSVAHHELPLAHLLSAQPLLWGVWVQTLKPRMQMFLAQELVTKP